MVHLRGQLQINDQKQTSDENSIGYTQEKYRCLHGNLIKACGIPGSVAQEDTMSFVHLSMF